MGKNFLDLMLAFGLLLLMDLTNEGAILPETKVDDNQCYYGENRKLNIKKLLVHYELTDNTFCRQLLLPPLRDLHEIIEVSAKNACGLNTLVLTERFKKDYISDNGSLITTSNHTLPEPLHLFFEQLIDDTIKRCTLTLQGRSGQQQVESDELDLLAKSIIRSKSRNLIMTDSLDDDHIEEHKRTDTLNSTAHNVLLTIAMILLAILLVWVAIGTIIFHWLMQ